MGINRTRRLFGRQKKDAWAANQYTLYGFRPRCYPFLSPLFMFFSLWSRKLHIRYAHRYFLDIYETLEQSKELSRRGFWLDDRCLKMTIGFTLLLHSFTCWRSFTHFFLSERSGTYVNLCFSRFWKKVETLINKFNFLLQVRKPDVLHFSVRKKKKQTVVQATIRLTWIPVCPCYISFVAAFLIWFSMISCSPFFTYLSRLSNAVFHSWSCALFNFQQLSRALSVRTWNQLEKTLEIFTDTRLQ